MSPAARPELICRLCGCVHRVPALKPGERAECVRCGSTLAQQPWLGDDVPLAFTLTGALLAVPAMTLPFVTVAKFGATRASEALSGVQALWKADMRLTAIWVLLCGAVVPLLLLGTLTGLLLPPRLGWPARGAGVLRRLAAALEDWAMPEIHVLAVLVAFSKLGSLVTVHPGAGLVCYAAMAGCLLVAWRSFGLRPAPHTPPPAVSEDFAKP